MLAKDLDFKESLVWFRSNFNLEGNFNYNLSSPIKTEELKKLESDLRTKSLLFEELVRVGREKLFTKEGEDCLKYLVDKRKYDIAILKKTEFLYLPPQTEAREILAKAFPDQLEDIKELKLNGYYGDNFRLVFPYRDVNGVITGFIKRATTPEGFSGTNWDGKEIKDQRFDSSTGISKNDLFGLYKIKKHDTLLVVEGYPDAMYLYELGIANIVAVGQGKFSKTHLEGLNKKGVKNVIIAFDNDSEGPANTVRGVKLLLSHSNVEAFVLEPKLYGNQKDPDEFVRAEGLDAFKQLLNKVQKGVSWSVKHILENSVSKSEVDKAKDLDEALEIYLLVSNPIEQSEIKGIIAKHLNCNLPVVNKLIKDKEKLAKKASDSTGDFWVISKEGVLINVKNYLEFIARQGFAKFYLDKDYTFIQVEINKVKEISLPQIKDFILDYVNKLPEDEDETRRKLYEALCEQVSKYFNEGLIECIPPREIRFKRDEKDKAYLYYENGYVVISKNAAPVINTLDSLDSPIWYHAINNREIELISDKVQKSEFEQFLFNVSAKDESRFKTICSAIGYLIHDYKLQSGSKAVVFYDEKISTEAQPNGRTGKSMIGKALEKLKNVQRIDGKNFKFREQFTFQAVKLDTRIIDFNDVEKTFDFEKLFSVITDGMSVEYKNKPAFNIPHSESPKILISTNYTIKGNGDSFKARMFEVEFSDHYSVNNTPIMEFGHEFFTEWDIAEWNRFDNFMIECLQFYLDKGLTKTKSINIDKKKLIDQTSPEFIEFMDDKIKLGGVMILKSLYSDFVEFLGFGQDIFNKCQVTNIMFSKWLSVYVELNDLNLVKL